MHYFARYFLLLFATLPFLTLLYLSVVSRWTFPQLIDATFSLGLWQNLLRNQNQIGYSFGISILLGSSVSVLATIFGFYVSKALWLEKHSARFLQLAFYPYLIPPVVLGAMLQFYFVRLGLTGTIFGVFVAQLLFILPYSVLLLSTFWTEQIRQLVLQAHSLGASDQHVNRLILLPMAKPWLGLCLVQCFLFSWFEYGITQYVGIGKVPTLTIQAMHFIKEANPHWAALIACLMLFPLLILLWMKQKLLTRL